MASRGRPSNTKSGRSRLAKPEANGLGRYVGPLLGVLSLLYTLYTGMSAGNVERGELHQFKQQQEKANSESRESRQRLWDALNAHKDKSEEQHAQLRREIESDMKREIDIALRAIK